MLIYQITIKWKYQVASSLEEKYWIGIISLTPQQYIESKKKFAPVMVTFRFAFLSNVKFKSRCKIWWDKMLQTLLLLTFVGRTKYIHG